MSSSSSPCAACKFLRRKCTQDCVFAPHFPADNQKRFSDVHKIYGASNVAKMLQGMDAAHREDAVQSLAYEAAARIQNPVHGCVGQISLMQERKRELQMNLEHSKKVLASLVGPAAMSQMLRLCDSSSSAMLDHPQYKLLQQQQQQQLGAHVMQQWLLQQSQRQQQVQMRQPQPHQGSGSGAGGGGQLVIRERQQPLVIRDRDATAELEQEAAAALQVREEQEMFRMSYEEMHRQAQMNFEVQRKQQLEAEFMRLHQYQLMEEAARRGRGGAGPSGTTAELSPLLALGTGFDAMNPYHVQQQQQQYQLMEEATRRGRGGAGPSGTTAELSPLLALGSGSDAMNPYHVQQQQQQYQLMEEATRRGRGGAGPGPSRTTAELSPLLALGSGFDAMNPYHVQQQQQQQPLPMLHQPQNQPQQPQHQQQQEIQDIQLFPYHSLHPPDPQNGAG